MMTQAKLNRSEPRSTPLVYEAQRALDRALQLPAIARMERLVTLANQYPSHGPTWLAMSEEHAAAGRNEEARGALRSALRVDPALRGEVSHTLRGIAGKVIAEADERDAEPSPARPAQPASAPKFAGNDNHRSAQGGVNAAAARELAQVMKLPLERRCDQLAELAMLHPGHGPIWLALAEDHLAESRAEYAVSAYDRALTLDPTLHALASRKLEALHRYHRKVRLPAPKIERMVASPDKPKLTAVSDAKGKTASKASRIARGTTPPPALSSVPAATPAPTSPRVAGISENSIHIGLARALEFPDRDRRLRELYDLERKAPDAPSILFHLALELALDGNVQEARKVADRLMEISPQHYRRLYEVADRHWPAQDGRKLAGVGAKSLEPTKILDLSSVLLDATIEGAAPVPQSVYTQILPELHPPVQRPVAPEPAPRPNPEMLALPAPSDPKRAGTVGMRALAFLAVGVLAGVILVVVLSWAMPAVTGSEMWHDISAFAADIVSHNGAGESSAGHDQVHAGTNLP